MLNSLKQKAMTEMKDILEFNDQFLFSAKDMIDFATWWQGVSFRHSLQPGPTSPDLKDWIEIYKLQNDEETNT